MHGRLPKGELALCVVVWSLSFAYSLYRVFQDGDELRRRFALGSNDFEPGWSVLGGRVRDVTDFDWTLWTNLLVRLIPWTLLHLTVAEALRRHDVHAVPVGHFLVTLGSVVTNFPVVFAQLLIGEFLLFFVASFSRSKVFIWLCTVCLLFFYNALPDILQVNYSVKYDDIVLIHVCMGWFLLKCTDFALSERNSSHPTERFMDFLGYAFYLPSFFLGPFIPYDCLVIDLYSKPRPWTLNRIFDLTRNLTKVFFWYCFFQLTAHFLYCHSMHYRVVDVVPLGLWTLNGVGLCMAQFFMVKYIVLYGASACIAWTEGYQAPPTPRCVFRIHLYSNMWRHFDRGFYLFMINNIYMPVCSVKTPPLWKRLLASFVCFSFVFVWHGLQMTIFVWSILNFLGVAGETVARSFRKTRTFVWFRSCFNATNWRRLEAASSAPLWVMAVISNYVFFGGHELGMVYIEKILDSSWQALATIYLVSYCMCHTSIETYRREELKLNNQKHKPE